MIGANVGQWGTKALASVDGRMLLSRLDQALQHDWQVKSPSNKLYVKVNTNCVSERDLFYEWIVVDA